MADEHAVMLLYSNISQRSNVLASIIPWDSHQFAVQGCNYIFYVLQ